MLTSVGCFGGSRAVRPVFELLRKTGAVAKKTDLRMCALNCIRPSVDGLCRDGPSEISRDPRQNGFKLSQKG